MDYILKNRQTIHVVNALKIYKYFLNNLENIFAASVEGIFKVVNIFTFGGLIVFFLKVFLFL